MRDGTPRVAFGSINLPILLRIGLRPDIRPAQLPLEANHLVALNDIIRRRSETKISNLLTYPQTPNLLVVLSATAFRAAAAARNPDKLSRLGAATSGFLGGAVAGA